MKLQFINPVVFVQDIERSRKFYQEVLNLRLVQDGGVFLLFENHFSIHQAAALEANIFGQELSSGRELQGKENLLLYFETPDLEEAYNRIQDQVELIHPIVQQSWGQKVFRFYDPDRHIIEIGEPL